jgi:predicted O-methyltransferase YrrM
MKQIKLSVLPVVPESYDAEHYDNVDYSDIYSLMTPTERRFINGLLRYYQPQHILELGVHNGGGTVNILNAIEDFPEAKLVSVDVRADDGCGLEAKKRYPDLVGDKWHLVLGKDVSEVIAGLETKFDFAVIDTSHYHPVEGLNFLSILPFMHDGAIVIIHDIALFLGNETPGTNLAPRYLYSAVVADKLVPQYGTEVHPNRVAEPANIAAIQITEDTRKYIENVFDALLQPWELYPGEYIESIRSHLRKYYPSELTAKLDTACELNKIWIVSGKRTFDIAHMRKLYESIYSTPTIFYGAGIYMRRFISLCKEYRLPFKGKIWDRNADQIIRICGCDVVTPDFTAVNTSNTKIIIMMENMKVAREIAAQLEQLGYTVFFGIDDYMSKGVKND